MKMPCLIHGHRDKSDTFRQEHPKGIFSPTHQKPIGPPEQDENLENISCDTMSEGSKQKSSWVRYWTDLEKTLRQTCSGCS
jgi:hypothetical protein